MFLLVAFQLATQWYRSSASHPCLLILKLLLTVKKSVAARPAWDPVILKCVNLPSHVSECCLRDLTPSQISLELFLVAVISAKNFYLNLQATAFHQDREILLWFISE